MGRPRVHHGSTKGSIGSPWVHHQVILPNLKFEFLSNYWVDLNQIWNLNKEDQNNTVLMEGNLNGRQPQLKTSIMKDDLKNFKLYFVIHHLVDLKLQLWIPYQNTEGTTWRQPYWKTISMEDYRYARLPKIDKAWSSQQPLDGSLWNIKLILREPNQNIWRLEMKMTSVEENLYGRWPNKICYLRNHWVDLNKMLNLSSQILAKTEAILTKTLRLEFKTT